MTKYAVISEDGLMSSFYSEDVHGARMRPVYGPLPDATEDNPNPVAPVIGEEPNPVCKIPSDAIEITDEQWLDLINNRFTRKWDGQNYVVYDPPTPEPIIPDRVSRRQFRRKLFDDGSLGPVEAWIAQQDIGTQMCYADAQSFVRTDEMMQRGFAALGSPSMGSLLLRRVCRPGCRWVEFFALSVPHPLT
jgi:hypothetical protein